VDPWSLSLSACFFGESIMYGSRSDRSRYLYWLVESRSETSSTTRATFRQERCTVISLGGTGNSGFVNRTMWTLPTPTEVRALSGDYADHRLASM
jgi:hypothetical protein